MPTQENLLIAFSGALVLWIVWRDVRPFLINTVLARKIRGDTSSGTEDSTERMRAEQLLLKERRANQEREEKAQTVALRLATAQALDDLFAEGVRERNRLIPAIPNFGAAAERAKIEEWSDRVHAKMDARCVQMREISRFRTLNQFEPKFHRDTGKTAEQEKLEAIWSEKLSRLEDAIRKLGS